MNTSMLIQQKIKEGKMKLGECDNKDCKHYEHLFRVRNEFICSDCLEKLETKLKELGMI